MLCFYHAGIFDAGIIGVIYTSNIQLTGARSSNETGIINNPTIARAVPIWLRENPRPPNNVVCKHE